MLAVYNVTARTLRLAPGTIGAAGIAVPRDCLARDSRVADHEGVDKIQPYGVRWIVDAARNGGAEPA